MYGYSSYSSSAAVVDPPEPFSGKAEADVVVIGSGIGGLCCAELLARCVEDVLVLESHDLPGGAAHASEIKNFKFDSGPSLFSGLQSRDPQVLDASGESIPCATYDLWMVYIPEGEFLSRIGPTEFFKLMLEIGYPLNHMKLFDLPPRTNKELRLLTYHRRLEC